MKTSVVVNLARNMLYICIARSMFTAQNCSCWLSHQVALKHNPSTHWVYVKQVLTSCCVGFLTRGLSAWMIIWLFLDTLFQCSGFHSCSWWFIDYLLKNSRLIFEWLYYNSHSFLCHLILSCLLSPYVFGKTLASSSTFSCLFLVKELNLKLTS